MTFKPNLQSPAIPLLCLALISIIFFIFNLFPIGDGDYFWHLATGRWIFEHHTLPLSDPFSFTVTDHNPYRPESQRIPFILKQYWLGQLILYCNVKLFGTTSIIVLRAVLYTILMSLMFFWMRHNNKGMVPVIIIVLTGLILREFPNERPQLFSFIIAPFFLFLLENATSPKNSTRITSQLLLPVVMVVWANLHAAYLVGVVCSALYAVPHGIRYIRKRSLPQISFLATLLVTLAASFMTPTTTLAWSEFFSSSKEYTGTIYENLTPWYAAVTLHDWHSAYWLFLLLCCLTILMRWRTMQLQHLLVITALMLLSLTGLRHIAYPFLAVPLLAPYLPHLEWDKENLGLLFFTLGCIVFMNRSELTLDKDMNNMFPVAATSFINRTIPSPNTFNFYNWGGYLAWASPRTKTFIDGRGLVEELSVQYDKTMHAIEWRDTFEQYSINTVIIPGMTENPGTVYELAEALSASPEWHLLFADSVALVFVRQTPLNRESIKKYELDKRALQEHLVQLANRHIKTNPKRELYWLTKANALARLGNHQGARDAYSTVIRLNPENSFAKYMLTVVSTQQQTHANEGR